jgi:hypothetical protein
VWGIQNPLFTEYSFLYSDESLCFPFTFILLQFYWIVSSRYLLETPTCQSYRAGSLPLNLPTWALFQKCLICHLSTTVLPPFTCCKASPHSFACNILTWSSLDQLLACAHISTYSKTSFMDLTFHSPILDAKDTALTLPPSNKFCICCLRNTTLPSTDLFHYYKVIWCQKFRILVLQEYQNEPSITRKRQSKNRCQAAKPHTIEILLNSALSSWSATRQYMTSTQPSNDTMMAQFQGFKQEQSNKRWTIMNTWKLLCNHLQIQESVPNEFISNPNPLYSHYHVTIFIYILGITLFLPLSMTYFISPPLFLGVLWQIEIS